MPDLNYIDLFAGAGGLSEGFVKEGFDAIAHVEINKDASDTLKTRLAFHYLKQSHKISSYYEYLKNEISREDLWNSVPRNLIQSVINEEISSRTIQDIFSKIDCQLNSRKVDVIIGGPPCQAYSLVGRSRDPHGMKWDKRNFLFRYYVQFLFYYKPKYFVFENVLGLLSAGNSKYLIEILELFSDAGYSADFKVLNSEEFGVLQKRRRVIIIGRRGRKKFVFPEIKFVENEYGIKKDLFFDLPSLNPGQQFHNAKYINPVNKYLFGAGIRNRLEYVTQHIARLHNERDLEIYSIAIDKWLNFKKRLNYCDLPRRLMTHNNVVSFLDRYKVVDPDGHSHTIVAHISQDGHYYIYPDLNQIRSISVREAARIQSFPDDFYFEGGRTSIFKQIGNAVPPLMARGIAAKIKELIQ
ncbi:MAG TPA: DNA cytosine methyltransferase [Puia sp.]|nr:DNA cytosine methyltransferase [Puia sp.]